MDILTKNHLDRFSWLAAFALILLLSACGDGTTSTHVTPGQAVPAHPTATATAFLLTGPITYVALGASDAVGVGSSQPGSQGYVPLLSQRLPRGSHTINLGISGIRLHEALTEELPVALTTAPDLVTIWLAANDFVGGVSYNDYISDLDTLLRQLHAGTHARLVMANLPDLTLLPLFAGQTATQKTQTHQQIEHWNAGIAAMAQRYGVVQVDLFSHGSELTTHPDYISRDGFHPSRLGYIQLADLFWQVIT